MSSINASFHSAQTGDQARRVAKTHGFIAVELNAVTMTRQVRWEIRMPGRG